MWPSLLITYMTLYNVMKGLFKNEDEALKKWVVSAKRADFDAIGRELNISPMLARIVRNRDVIETESVRKFLFGELSDLNDPYLLKDIRSGVSLVLDSARSGGKIRIIGDYDADGVCATYILYKTLSRLSKNVSYQLPDRIKDGYGLNSTMIDKAYGDGISLIITCDNGIAAVEEIAYAKKLGISVVVTDHHECPMILPEADAIIDPKQPECNYPYKEICGAVVAYKFCQILCSEAGLDFREDLIEFAAFATICDVMPLLDENRIIVKYGLKSMQHTKNIGLRALIDSTGIDKSKLSAYHIGFILGPCINATGRLDLANRALELLITDSVREAATIASSLKELNESRKDMTTLYTKQALNVVLNGDEYNPSMNDLSVLVIYLPDCHESIAGIVAGHVREQYYKPTIILTKAEVGVKGSGRSIEAYNMFEALCDVEDIFTKFGGHKMAAGMSLPTERIDELRDRLNALSKLTPDDLIEKITIDIPMPLQYVTEDFIEELEMLSPYGVGNPKPLFAQKNLIVKNIRIQGRQSNVVKLSFEGEKVSGILFTDGDDFIKEYSEGMKVSVIYTPEINEYMGTRSIQAAIKEIRPDT